MKKVTVFSMLLIFFATTSFVFAKPPVKSKFYNFDEQLIDGEIRKPSNTYIDYRQRAKFERLLKLKKSFLPELFQTARERVFK